MKSKIQLDVEVAAAIGVPLREVSTITSVYLEELKRALIEDGNVKLYGVGKLSLRFGAGSRNIGRRRTDPMKVQVHFSKSKLFRQQIQRHYDIGKE